MSAESIWTGYKTVESDPELGGLTILEVIDDPQASYTFDVIILLRHNDGRLFWASDAGCSCPRPFEGFRTLDDLNALHAGSIGAFISEVENWCTYSGPSAVTERQRMIRAAQDALAEAAK